MERDLSTAKMEEKALSDISNEEKFDESKKRAMLATAIGFEMTCAMVKL